MYVRIYSYAAVYLSREMFSRFSWLNKHVGIGHRYFSISIYIFLDILSVRKISRFFFERDKTFSGFTEYNGAKYVQLRRRYRSIFLAANTYSPCGVRMTDTEAIQHRRIQYLRGIRRVDSRATLS